MDQTENQKQKSLTQFIRSQFHRSFTQLLLSVSVFSLWFSHSYWLCLLPSFSINFQNTLPFQLFNHTIDKNCIFLLCNGLLVFLAKYSGLISSSKYNLSDDDDDDDQRFKSYEDVLQSESIVLEPKAPLLEKEVALESDKAVENSIAAAAEIETQNFTLVEEEEEEEEKWGSTTNGEELDAAFVGEDEEELKGSDDDIFVQDFKPSENSDIELRERNRVLTTEELNKKFDEFIRKMKEELRIEARQQLVMV